MTSVCIVQARTGSSRLPGKVLAEVGGRPMLRFMLDRLEHLRVDELVVATSDLSRDDPVAEIGSAAGVSVVRGDEGDVLSRYATALDAYPADNVVRLTADCPLADPAIVEAALALHAESGADYTSNVLPRTFPKGLDVEVMTADALRRAAAQATDPPEREHVTPFLYRHPEWFRLANLRSGADLGGERWTVDTADDLDFVRRLVVRLAPEDRFGWRDALTVAGRTVVAEPGSLRLRTAQPSDEDLLLRWRNDADAVSWSVSGATVDADEHRRWFAQRLADPSTRIWMAEREGAAIGSVRIEVRAAVGEISIVVAPVARGQSMGSSILQLLQAELQGDFQVVALEALIHPGNVASLKAFEKVGFEATGEKGAFKMLRWATMDGRREANP